MTSDTAGDEQIFNVTLANSNLGNEALAFVEIKEVPIATDAGSALTSLGITEADSQLVDVLFFHDDNGLTPNNELPMDGSSPDSAGFVESPNGNTLEFISASMTASTTIQPGVFNASLNYFSNVVPLGFPEPTFAFMMDSKDCGASQRICDEIGNIDNDKGMKEEEQDPSFSGDFDDGGGPDGDQYFRFDESNGDERFQDDGNFDNLEPLQYPDTMAVWVRIPATSESYQPIVHFGHPWEDEMELAVVTGGEIEFQFGTGTYGSDSVDCTSPLEYDNNRWVHVVGVRDAPHDCKLYINGQQVDSDSASYSSVSVDVDFNAIGTSEDDGSPELSADVASYIFWDDAALTAEQVNDLYYTNYGNNGTRLYMTIERTDVDGVALETIVPETKLELPYHSVTINQDDGDPGDWLSLQTHNLTDTGEDSYLKYSQANMTWHSDSAVTFAPTERIKLTLDWKDEDESNLPINIVMDTDFSDVWELPDGPSFLQTPPPEPRWPTFLSFQYDEQVEYLAYNEGPGGIWFVYSGTRLVLTSNDGLTSYAAVPYTVNASTQPTPVADYSQITADQDSIYIPAEHCAEIDFYQLQSPPKPDNSPPSVNEVPTGDYDAALYLQGYDELGETFKKTVDLGLIHIYGNP